MTPTIEKLFNYARKLREYGEDADANPELESELKTKWQQTIDELESKKQEHSEAVEKEILELRGAGKDINPYDPKTKASLLHFVASGMLDNRLLQHFTANDIKQSDKLLSIAICNNNIDSIKWLLDNGVSPSAKDEDGDTMLQLALWNDKSGQIARLLIEKGADVNAQNTDGCTALQSAIPIHDISIVKLLLEQGADVNIKDNHNSSALDKIFVRCYINDNEIIASDNIRLETLKLLIDHGAEITSKEISQAMWYKFQQEISTSKALLLMLGSAQNIKIDLTDYGIHQFFTSEDNIKALFAVDGYESQKAIAKENIFKSLQEYGEIHNNPKALDIAQLVAEQGVDLPNAEITEDLELPDHLDHKAELAGDIQDNNPDAADAA